MFILSRQLDETWPNEEEKQEAGKNTRCTGKSKNDKRNDFALEALFRFTARTEFLMYFQVIPCTRTYQDGLGWFVIAVTGAPRLGLQHFVPVDPASQLVGQPVKPARQRDLNLAVFYRDHAAVVVIVVGPSHVSKGG